MTRLGWDVMVVTHWQLSPSATMLRCPGTCQTAIMLCVSILSRHLACAADMLSFDRTSSRALQSVSISTRNPHIMSEK